jgi:acylphosphatase
MIAKRCLVSGRVQGVFYRASTKEQARSRGIVGYAKNLADGRVEVLAVGASADVDALVAWLREGPPTARVAHVEVENVPMAELADFPVEFLTR